MNTPPLLAGATLVFWGWQTELLVVGSGAAVLLESSRLLRLRLDLAERDLRRLWGLCWLATLCLAVFVITGSATRVAIPQVLQWLPLTLLPMAAAQSYSTLARIPLQVLTLREPRWSRPLAIDLTYPYLAVCLLAASAANVRTPAFFAGLVVLCTWALWTVRSTRVPMAIWSVLLVVVIGLGYAGQIGLNRLQSAVIDMATGLFVGSGSRTDPYRSTTALGKIGDRKASSAIVARVFPHAGKTVPQRLHEATYDGFASPHWYASESPLQPVTAPAHSATWILGEVAGVEDRFTVAVTTDRRRTVLALPWGALRLKDLRVDGLLRNDLGVVEIRQNPGPLRFTVAFDPRVSRQTTPTERDLVVPVSEREHVTAVAADLNLVAASPAQALQALERWFRSEFDYALFQPERLPSRSPLADFLTTTRAGHCEYFATATVLLLRAAGIPARYATGFAVQEFSERERAYLVRERHAHAWARAYVDGRWRDVDTTPATWHTIESEQDAFFQPLSDYLSWLLFAHRQWQAEAAPRRLTWLWLALLPVLGYAAWRLWKRRAPRTGSKVEPAQRTIVATGLDSAFYRLDSTLRDTPLARAPDELVSTWIERLSQRLPGVPDIADLRQIIALHYRYRFDPVGLEHDERQRLAELVDAWLVRFREANGA